MYKMYTVGRNFQLGDEKMKRDIKLGLWLTLGFYTVALLPFLFYSSQWVTFHSTSDLPCPLEFYTPDSGTLTWFIDGFYSVHLLVVLTTCAFLAYHNTFSWLRVVHTVTVAVVLAWSISVMAINGIDYANANDGDGSSLVTADDPYKCCVFYSSARCASQCPGAETTDACSMLSAPGNEDQLDVSRMFLFKYWYNVGLIVVLVVNLVLTYLLWNSHRKIVSLVPVDDTTRVERRHHHRGGGRMSKLKSTTLPEKKTLLYTFA
jgi:hypothetical protein